MPLLGWKHRLSLDDDILWEAIERIDLLELDFVVSDADNVRLWVLRWLSSLHKTSDGDGAVRLQCPESGMSTSDFGERNDLYPVV